MQPEQPKNTEPSQDKTVPVDSSKWFQKDTSSSGAVLSKNHFHFSHMQLIWALVATLVVLSVVGVSFAMLTNSKNEQAVADQPSVSQPVVTQNTNAAEQTEAQPAPTSQAEPAPTTPAAPAPTPKPIPTVPAATPSPAPAPAPAPTPPVPVSHTMTYSNSCYSPQNLTIKKGDTINFVNNSNTRKMWPASDNHPSHTIYSEFDANKGYNTGETYSFTFNNAGTWGYHDHLRSSCEGTITIQ